MRFVIPVYASNWRKTSYCVMFFPWQFQPTFVRFLTGENKPNSSMNIALHVFSEPPSWMGLKWLLNDVTIHALKTGPGSFVPQAPVGFIGSGGDVIMHRELIVLVGSYRGTSGGFGLGNERIPMALTGRRQGRWHNKDMPHCSARPCCSQSLRAARPHVFGRLCCFLAWSLLGEPPSHHCRPNEHP